MNIQPPNLPTPDFNMPHGALAKDVDGPEPQDCPGCEGEGCSQCAGLGVQETTRPRGFKYSGHYRDPFQGRKSV